VFVEWRFIYAYYDNVEPVPVAARSKDVCLL